MIRILAIFFLLTDCVSSTITSEEIKDNDTLVLQFQSLKEAIGIESVSGKSIFIDEPDGIVMNKNEVIYIKSEIIISGTYGAGQKQKISIYPSSSFLIEENGKLVMKNLEFVEIPDLNENQEIFYYLQKGGQIFLFSIDFFGIYNGSTFDFSGNNTINLVNCTLTIEFSTRSSSTFFYSKERENNNSSFITLKGLYVKNASNFILISGNAVIGNLNLERISFNGSSNFSLLSNSTVHLLFINDLVVTNCIIDNLINLENIQANETEPSKFFINSVSIYNSKIFGVLLSITNYSLLSISQLTIADSQSTKALIKAYNIFSLNLTEILFDKSVFHSDLFYLNNVEKILFKSSRLKNNNFNNSYSIVIENAKFFKYEGLQAVNNVFFDSSLIIVKSSTFESFILINAMLVSENLFFSNRTSNIFSFQGNIEIEIEDMLLTNSKFFFQGTLFRIEALAAAFSFSKAIFSFNLAQYGASLVNFQGSQLNLMDSFITNNTNLNGLKPGGIIFRGQLFKSRDTIFSGNYAIIGAVFSFEGNFEAPSSIVTFVNCSIVDTKGENSALIFKDSNGIKLIIDKCLFSNNKLDNHGVIFIRALGIEYKFHFIFQNSKFIRNEAYTGGAIFMYSSLMNYTFENCLFMVNKARKGGALYINTESNNYITLKNCMFLFNKAYESAVYHLILGVLIDSNCIYFGNSATFASTSKIGSYSSAFFQNSLIVNSFSEISFNIVCQGSSSVEIYNTLIYNCTSSSISAALAYYSMAKLSCIGCTFSQLQCKTGTIIYGAYALSDATLVNCTIVNSRSTLNSLFYLKSVSVKLSQIRISNNTGNLLYLSESKFIVNFTVVYRTLSEPYQLFYLLFAESRSIIEFHEFNLLKVDSFKSSNEKYLFSIQSGSRLSLTSSLLVPNLSANLNCLFYSANSELRVFETKIVSSHQIFYSENSNFSLNFLYAFNIQSKIKNSSTTGITFMNSEFKIMNSSFFNYSNSALRLLACNSNVNLIENCLIKFCSSSFGGAAFVENSHIMITNTLFQNNRAMAQGGALYFDCDRMGNCTWILKISKFSDNIAKAGLGIFWTTHPPDIDEYSKVIYLANVNESNFIASAPLYLYPDFRNNFSQFNSFPPGESLKNNLLFIHKDCYNSTVNYLTPASVKIILYQKSRPNTTVKEKYTILGKNIVYDEGGVFQFDDLRFVGSPNTLGIIRVESELISKFREKEIRRCLATNTIDNHKNISETGAYSYIFSINFSQCLHGQVFNPELNICYDCPEGSYTLSNHAQTCSICPENAYCPGLAVIDLKPGFWRSSSSVTNIYKCKIESACVGGPLEKSCLVGFTGPLCDVCDTAAIEREGRNVYYKDMDKLCKNCNSEDRLKSNLLISVIIILSILYVAYMINEKLQNSHNLRSDLLKIFTEFMQVNSLLFSVGVDLPINMQSIKFMNDVFDLIDPNSMLLSLECSSSVLNYDLNIFFKKLIVVGLIAASGPVLIFFVALALHLIRKKKMSDFRKTLTVSYLIAFYSYQPVFIKTFFSAFNCNEIEGTKYIAKFLGEECWSKSHINLILYLVMPMLSLIMIVVPVVFLSKMILRYKRKQSLENYSFFSNSYRRKLFFWDFIPMVQKYLIISALTFVPSLKAMYIMNGFFVFSFLLFEQIIRPYRTHIVNKVSTIRSVAIFITINYLSLKSLTNPSSVVSLFWMILFYVINIYFIIYYLRIFYLMKKNIMILVHKVIPFCSTRSYYLDEKTAKKIYFDSKSEQIELPVWIKSISLIKGFISPKNKASNNSSEQSRTISLDNRFPAGENSNSDSSSGRVLKKSRFRFDFSVKKFEMTSNE